MEEASDSELWAEYHQQSAKKKASNEIFSINLLRSKGIKIVILSAKNRHYRVGDFDFWPSTGKFYNQKTKQKGRGVKNLLKFL